MKKVPHTKVTELARMGEISLVRLERKGDAIPMFGVTAPYPVGKDDEGRRIYGKNVCEQFFSESEARHMFIRLCKCRGTV